ncbi:3-carboxy-cis,cis-muconate cycloisomerase [compost metagenome]|uniref:3-carboxy-cis,cis-muconate cycloisomerase n=1 Tax=Achromobacter sp. Root83 TaxID=1736602 RepID=UPI000B21C08A|nr:3-carboxy-cis,cis-muconate cycloisomerase [Achromobacter sp. Root83]
MGTLTDLIRGHPAMNAVWSEAGTLQAMLDVEAALATSCAEHGVIPFDAVAPIVAACRVELFDIDSLKNDATAGGNLAIPLVRQLTAEVKRTDSKAAGYVHWGATSQDIIDTGLVLQLRSALDILRQQLDRLACGLAALASEHRATPTVGRTWLQQALPMTFGLKFAQYLDTVGRLQDALAAHQESVAVLQFGGAAGTLASLGEHAFAVSRALARQLGLALPDVPWHTQRDRLVSVAAWMGMATGACAKMARDMSLLAQTEVGEVAEASGKGKGGSSTMPHKRNPVGCASVLSAGLRAPHLVATLFSCMVQEHERALGGWQAEWDALPELAVITGGAVATTADIMAGLEVHSDRMLRNLNATQGLIQAEAVMLELGKCIGRLPAHELIEKASRQAVVSQRALLDVLSEDTAVTKVVSPERLAHLLSPLNYCGQSMHFVDTVLGRYRERVDSPDAVGRTEQE